MEVARGRHRPASKKYSFFLMDLTLSWNPATNLRFPLRSTYLFFSPENCPYGQFWNRVEMGNFGNKIAHREENCPSGFLAPKAPKRNSKTWCQGEQAFARRRRAKFLGGKMGNFMGNFRFLADGQFWNTMGHSEIADGQF